MAKPKHAKRTPAPVVKSAAPQAVSAPILSNSSTILPTSVPAGTISASQLPYPPITRFLQAKAASRRMRWIGFRYAINISTAALFIGLLITTPPPINGREDFLAMVRFRVFVLDDSACCLPGSAIITCSDI